MNLVAVEGDVDNASNAHSDPSEGGGSKTITPVDRQTFVSINDKPVVTKGEDFILTGCGQCSATCYAGQLSECSTVWNINEIPVCRDGDISQDGAHTFSGIVVSNQNFVFSD